MQKAANFGIEHHRNNNNNNNNNDSISSNSNSNSSIGLDKLAPPFGFVENMHPTVIESIKQSLIMDIAQNATNTADSSSSPPNVSVNAHQQTLNQVQLPWIADSTAATPVSSLTNHEHAHKIGQTGHHEGVDMNGNINGNISMPLTQSNLLHQQQQTMQFHQHHNGIGVGPGLNINSPCHINNFGQQQQAQTQQPHQTQQNSQHEIMVANLKMNMNMHGSFSSPQPTFANSSSATPQHQIQQTKIQNHPVQNQILSQHQRQNILNAQPHYQYMPQQLLSMPMHNIYIGQQAVHSIHQQQEQSKSNLSAPAFQHQHQGNKRKTHESNMQILPQAIEEETSNTAISASTSSGTGRGRMVATSISELAVMPVPISYTDSILAQANPPNPKRTKLGSHSSSTQFKPAKDMTPDERRKHGRNSREQQRSQKISLQINDLRQVLSEAKVPFKRNKFSILMSVVDYIKHLQERASFLDHEHLKLINTMQQTSEMTHSGLVQKAEDFPEIGNDAELLYVKGLDYKSIFEQCSFPLGVAALDGRFLTWNSKFEALTGMKKENLQSATLFMLLAAHDTDEVFRALGTLLRNSDTDDGNATSKNLNKGCESSLHFDGDDASRKDNGSSEDIISGGCEEKSDENNGDGASSGDDNGISSGDDSGLTTVTNGYWIGTLSKPFQNVSWLLLFQAMVDKHHFCIVLYCTVLYCTVLYCTVLYCTVLYTDP